MRFIFHQKLTNTISNVCYDFGKTMLYFLGEKIHMSGINEFTYNLLDAQNSNDTNFKLTILMKWSQEEEDKQNYEAVLQFFKKYPKIKNKNSALIVSYNKLKKSVDKDFNIASEGLYNNMEKLFGLKTFCELIDYERINFYHLHEYDSVAANPKVTLLTDILSLQLPPEEGEFPILFLCNEDKNGNPYLAYKPHDVQSKESALLENTYLTNVFQFPGIVGIPNAEMRAISAEFSKESKLVKDQLHLWAKTCYENPNSSKGQEFFNQNIVPIVEEKRRLAFEINSMQEIVKVSRPDNTFHLEFGEMPIEKIWEMMYVMGNCTQEEYETLLKIKDSQSPKYDGRWPVAFHKTDNKNLYTIEEKRTENPQPRKTLDLD